MPHYFLLITIVLTISFICQASTASGSINLDDFNFDKVKNKFQASLIKFDKLFPIGEKHEVFMAFAREMIENEDVLVAELPVKNYADRTNVVLARIYGANEKDFPVIKLFIKDKTEPMTFNDSKGFTTDELRRFVQENSGLYLSLPGCFKEFDKLAIKFMQSEKDERKKVLNNTEELLKEKDTTSGNIYRKIMEKVLENDDVFIKSELDRVKKLLNGKVSNEKKKQLQTRINILMTFQLDKQTMETYHL